MHYYAFSNCYANLKAILFIRKPPYAPAKKNEDINRFGKLFE